MSEIPGPERAAKRAEQRPLILRVAVALQLLALGFDDDDPVAPAFILQMHLRRLSADQIHCMPQHLLRTLRTGSA